MRPWDRVPLRVRVALAFAAATAVALVALGAFLQVRVAATLEDQVRATLSARLDALGRLSAGQRDASVRETAGESVAQVIGTDGEVLVSSAGLERPVLPPGRLPAAGESALVDVELFLPTEDERVPVTLLAAGQDSAVLVVGTSTEDVEEVLAGLQAQLVWGGLLALTIASGLGYVVAGLALRPMEAMRRHAERISAASSDERLPLPRAQDEVHRLGSTLNDMLDRLDEGLRRERQFVAEAGHELRTPLALLRTELDLAASRSRTPEELAAFVASATEEVDRLADLVDRLLTLARADESGLDLELEPVRVRDLLTRVARRYRPLASARDIRVEPGPPVTVTADSRRLDQVVSNLVENAVRHGGGDVSLAVREEPGGVLITVSDEGRADLPDDLWGRFRRGEGSRAGGRGLGLSLVRAIVEEHGGEAWSDPDAGTTTVRVRLPA